MAGGDGHVVAVLRERHGFGYPAAALLPNPEVIDIQAHRLLLLDVFYPSSSLPYCESRYGFTVKVKYGA